MAKVSEKTVKDAEASLRADGTLPASETGVSWNPYRPDPFMTPADSEKYDETLAKGGQDVGAQVAAGTTSVGTGAGRST